MKLLALTPFHIYPPTFGGAERCWNLLSRIGQLDIIALNWEGHTTTKQIGDVHYQLIAADQPAVDQANKLRKQGIQTFDPIPTLTSTRLTTIRKAIDKANPDLIILEHPWLIDLIGERRYIYDAHNCETQNTATQYGTNGYDYGLVKSIEQQATEQAEHITYCSTQDIQTLKQLFNVTAPHTLIPNGVTPPTQHATGTTRNLIFIGSAYQPNVNAAQRLINLAAALPDYTIQILGQCANYLTNHHQNVQLIGQVTDTQLDNYFINAYAFVNLITEGSGTHLKLARALAYGIPVITTEHGARGYSNVTITNIGNLPQQLDNLNWQQQHQAGIQEATQLNWETIATNYSNVIEQHI